MPSGVSRRMKKPRSVARISPLHSGLSFMAMNDSPLCKGDILATDRGFFILRETPDGICNGFVPVPNPLAVGQKIKRELLAEPGRPRRLGNRITLREFV